MTTLLQIKTSLFEDGQSSQLADRLVARWQAANPDAEVTVRDLTTDPVPHLTAERFGALLTPPAERSAEQAAVAAYSDALIDELTRADVIVLALPMYNFGIPSTLKAYFDHVARSGITFRYTAEGPEGLVSGKRVYVVAARGGLYAGSSLDTQSDYVRNFLGFLGMRELEFVYAEGLNMGDEPKARGLASAREALDALPI